MNDCSVTFSPYKLILEKAKTPEFRLLAESLVNTSEEFFRLQSGFPKSIARNRASRRKKGTSVRYTKRQKEFLSDADKDAVKAAEQLAASYRSIADERVILKTALREEKFLYKTWGWLYDSVHDDDKPLANQIRRLQEKLIGDVENFLSATH
jgi:hypothetical protein